MTPEQIGAALSEYRKTISELSDRLAQMASHAARVGKELQEAQAELEKLKKKK